MVEIKAEHDKGAINSLKRIQEWKKRLIDLSRNNRLVYFKPTATSVLPIDYPDEQKMFEKLVVQEKELIFSILSEDDEMFDIFEDDIEDQDLSMDPSTASLRRLQNLNANEITSTILKRSDIARRLKNLFRRAKEDYQERGIHTLFVTFGCLEWVEQDESERIISPLLLCPVELRQESLRDPYILQLVDEEVDINPALKVKLARDFNINFPELPTEWSIKNLDAFLVQLQLMVANRNWSVTRPVYMSTFSFEKLGMFHDLEKNQEKILNHPCVQALCGNLEPLRIISDGSEVNPRELDQIMKPGDTFQILDADSSQQACIQAVLRGKSLILQGPPGTGKSQTIANMIGEFIARGKTVLFVSEKIAALEVVYKRLKDRGLADYCLELHSHKQKKKEVVDELYKSLLHLPATNDDINPQDFTKLNNLRTTLNGYDEAMHKVRTNDGESVFGLVSNYVGLKDIPEILLGNINVNEIEQRQEEWIDAVKRLSIVWDVAQQGNAFPWRGCRETEFGGAAKIRWDDILSRGNDSVHKYQLVLDDWTEHFGLDRAQNMEDATWLWLLAEILDKSVLPDPSWLTTDALQPVLDEAKVYRRITEGYLANHNALLGRWQDAFTSWSENTFHQLNQSWEILKKDLGHESRDAEGNLYLMFRQQLPDLLQEVTAYCADMERSIGELADTLGMVESSLTLNQVAIYARLALASNQPYKPETSWIHPMQQQEIRQFIDEFQPILAEYRRSKETILLSWDEEVLTIAMDPLVERFSGFLFSSPFRLVLPQYYADKKMLSRLARNGELPATLLDSLKQIREWQRLAKQLQSFDNRGNSVLGSYYRAEYTNLAAVQEALSLAELMAIALGEGVFKNLSNKFLLTGSLAPVSVAVIGERLQQRVEAVCIAVTRHEGLLTDNDFVSSSKPLMHTTLQSLREWSQRTLVSSSELEKVLCPLLATAKLTPVNISTISADLAIKLAMDNNLAAMAQESERLQALFGVRFAGLATTWEELLQAIQWTGELRNLFGDKPMPARFVQKVCIAEFPASSHKEFAHAHSNYEKFLTELQSWFELPYPHINGKTIADAPFAEIHAFLTNLKERFHEIADWIDYKKVTKRVQDAGLGEFLIHLEAAPPSKEYLVPILKKSVAKKRIDFYFGNDSRLVGFQGQHHETLIREFQETDERLIKLTGSRIIRACNAARPHLSAMKMPSSEMAILRREGNKQRRHLPIRTLFENIPGLLLKLKPCLMMSPLSVSQFIHPGLYQFDLIIFDEASQIFTEDAVVAMYRGRQVVIAGDSRQMPPTNFFRTTDAGYDEDEENNALNSADFGSVLDEMGTVLPGLMLRWHYRSKHESLIAFSNRQFYDSRLVTFPSAYSIDECYGVQFIHVPEGVYERSGRRCNPREAAVVVNHIFEHFSQYPNKSLGVVAFSQAQMQAIEDEVERRRLSQPQFEKYFKEDRLEGFFVKNLENVQGDERDVIFFSVGYGKDAAGKMSMNFGPLNREGGEKRLNVAITRAREKVKLISSIKAGDLDLRSSQAAGVLQLYHYLRYSELGKHALETDHPQGMGDCESPFEVDVMNAIRRIGYEGISQVGCSGYRIDIGIIDPAYPGQFLLGIECDGASYHSAATARDRDRLRQRILENLGWKIHRIWSKEWAYRREREIGRLKDAIEAARLRPNSQEKTKKEGNNAHSEAVSVKYIRLDADELQKLPEEFTQYKVTRLKQVASQRYGFIAPESRTDQIHLIVEIVKIEGPVHRDLVTTRLKEHWPIPRLTGKVRDVVNEAITRGANLGYYTLQDDFLWPDKARRISARVADPYNNETTRMVEYVPMEELDHAVRVILKHGLSLTEEDLISQTGKVFGQQRISERSRKRIGVVIEKMLKEGEIKWLGDYLTLN
mgnify:CR=1 FL=1